MSNNLRGKLAFKGERGYSSYEIAVQNGYPGTEEQFVQDYGISDTYSIEIMNARSGFDTLGNVISKKTYHFNTIAEMKACNKLKNGDCVQTLGYYSANDGGSGTYQIVNDSTLVDDGGSVHDITNGLKAKLIIKDGINVKQFGAYGDGVHNDTNAIQNMLLINKSLYLPKGKYKLSSPIQLTSWLIIDGNNSELIFSNDKIFTWENATDTIWNCEIRNLLITGNGSSTFMTGTELFRGGKIQNVRVRNIGLLSGNNNIEMLATIIDNCVFNTTSLFGRLKFHDGTIISSYFNCSDTEYGNTSCLILSGSLSNITGCFFNGNTSEGVPALLEILGTTGFTVSKCNFDYSDGYGIKADRNKGLTISECTFRGNGRLSGAYINNLSGEIKIRHCSFLKPHIETFPYNQNAYIVSSNGYSKNIILEDNYYEVNFKYDSEFNKGSDKIIIREPELFNSNVLPLSKEPHGNIREGLSISQTIDGFRLYGTPIAQTTYYLMGGYDTSDVLFTITPGNYKVLTNCQSVLLQIRTANETYNYNECENITVSCNIEVLSVALIIPANISYNKNIKYILSKVE